MRMLLWRASFYASCPLWVHKLLSGSLKFCCQPSNQSESFSVFFSNLPLRNVMSSFNEICFWSKILRSIKLPYSSLLRWHKQMELLSAVHFRIFIIYTRILACNSIFTYQSESLKLQLEPLHGSNQLQWEISVLHSVLKPYTLPIELRPWQGTLWIMEIG
jgi:hypothetical protein